jgi:hypothetical protein
MIPAVQHKLLTRRRRFLLTHLYCVSQLARRASSDEMIPSSSMTGRLTLLASTLVVEIRDQPQRRAAASLRWPSGRSAKVELQDFDLKPPGAMATATASSTPGSAPCSLACRAPRRYGARQVRALAAGSSSAPNAHPHQDEPRDTSGMLMFPNYSDCGGRSAVRLRHFCFVADRLFLPRFSSS